MIENLIPRKIGTQNPTGIYLTSTLDPIGNRLVLQHNYGSTTNTWDPQSRLLSIWNPYNERTTMTWDPLDREQHRVIANGSTISHTWDQAGNETLIENRNAAGAAQFVATNTYSPVNNRLTVLETDGTRATFLYDAASQVIGEARGGTLAYSRTYLWDPNGNRLQQSDNGALTTGTFNAANQLTLLTPQSGNATSSYYDGAGNLIGMNCGGALTTQTWSPENRLASYADPAGNNEQFLYSDDGLKKQRVNNSGTTLFTYDESALLLETTTGGVVLARYTNRPETWGGLASQNRSGVSSFYGLDSQQCARILVSLGGLVTDSYSYRAFGEAIQSGSGTINPYGYIANGLYYTEVVDLINAWNRWPRPSIGRWNNMDMLGFDGGDWNLYRYVRNNPVTEQDPSGWVPCSSPVGMPTINVLPFYGRFCGPQTKPGVRPGIDTLDGCCADHDDCFARQQPPCTASLGNMFRPACIECDLELCWCAFGANCKADWPGWRHFRKRIECEYIQKMVVGFMCTISGERHG
jgi:RHS repeat-associated protein